MKLINKIKELNRKRLNLRRATRINDKGSINEKKEVVEKLFDLVETLDPSGAIPLRQYHPETIPWIVSKRWNASDAKILKRIVGAISDIPEHIVVVPWLKHGGADLVACHIADALGNKYGNDKVIVLAADTNDLVAKNKLSSGIAAISLLTDEVLDLEDKAKTLAGVFFALRPKSIINVNSETCWEVYKTYGNYYSSRSKLSATLFCPDYDQMGRPDGYSTRYYRLCANWLDSVITDNVSFKNTLAFDYMVPDDYKDKIHAIKFPVSESIRKEIGTYSPDFHSTNRPIMLWASRICHQKNPAVLLRIAEKLPNIDFHVYGWGSVSDVREFIKNADKHANISYKGEFSSLRELNFNKAHGFIYTSLFDGLPNIIIEMGWLGVPIIAPDIGGIGELVCDETGWLIDDSNNVEAYVEGINNLLRDRDEAARRSLNMQNCLLKTHSYKQFLDNFSATVAP